MEQSCKDNGTQTLEESHFAWHWVWGEKGKYLVKCNETS